MTKKMGRPLKSSEPLSKNLVIRVSQSIYDELEKQAKEKGLSKTVYAREILEQILKGE
ncbi:hypothetical protein K6V64_10410 [Streptococcus suis]|nr:hypothetical protein [Streptococcus suis]